MFWAGERGSRVGVYIGGRFGSGFIKKIILIKKNKLKGGVSVGPNGSARVQRRFLGFVAAFGCAELTGFNFWRGVRWGFINWIWSPGLASAAADWVSVSLRGGYRSALGVSKLLRGIF